jgi:hypothetical protein
MTKDDKEQDTHKALTRGGVILQRDTSMSRVSAYVPALKQADTVCTSPDLAALMSSGIPVTCGVPPPVIVAQDVLKLMYQ